MNRIKKSLPAIALLFTIAVHAQQPPPVVTDTIERKIFNKAQTPPKFKGNFKKFLEKYLLYPTIAMSENIEGIVVMEFIVNEDGTLSNIVVAHNSPQKNKLLVEECIRTLEVSNGMWKPATQNGYVVACYHQQSINFVLKRK